MKKFWNDKTYSKFLATIYFYVIIILSLLITPLYIQTIRIVRNNISSELERNIRNGMNLFDNEMRAVHNTTTKIASSKEFLLMQKFGDVLRTEDYSVLKDFLYFFKNTTSFNYIFSENCLIMSKNNIVVSDNQIFDNQYSGFDSLYSVKGLTLTELKGMLFQGQSSSSEVIYDENFYSNGETKQSLIYFASVSDTLTSHPNAVLMNTIDIDVFLDLINIPDVLQSANVIITNNNEEVIYSSDRDIQNSKASYFYSKSAETGMTVKVFLSDAYYQENMRSIKFIVLLYIVFAIIIGVILALYFAYIQSKPLRNLVRLTESLTGTNDYENRGYDYIKDLVKTINEKNVYLNDIISKNLYEKFLNPGLTEADYTEFLKQHPRFPQPYNMVIFRGEQLTLEVIELLLNKENINNVILMTEGQDIVLFIKSPYDSSNEDALYQRMLNISRNIRNEGLDVEIAISMECESIYKAVECWKNTLNLFKFMDYRHVIKETEFRNEEYNINIINIEENRKLYEMIISGDAFSAKQIIYAQWYEIMKTFSSDEQIEQLVLSQRSIISNAINHLNYDMHIILKYDEDVKIDNLAFMVADIIDDICCFALKKIRDNETALNDELIVYINENFWATNFGMNDLTEKFKLSGKTISKIVKQKTQMLFPKYLNKLRMDKAKLLLSTTTLNISNVAEACGFGTENAFYKAFKSAVGVSPGDYRKSHV